MIVFIDRLIITAIRLCCTIVDSVYILWGNAVKPQPDALPPKAAETGAPFF
jgi:hypothetical protein